MDYYSFCNGLIFDSFLHMYLLSSYYCIRIDLILGEKLKRGGTQAGGGGANSRAGGNSIWGESQYTPSVCNPVEGGRRRRKRDEVRK